MIIKGEFEFFIFTAYNIYISTMVMKLRIRTFVIRNCDLIELIVDPTQWL